LIGGALARCNALKGPALRFHPDVGVPGKHRSRDVARDAHNYLVARAGLSQLGDSGGAAKGGIPSILGGEL
jgi:hypothetical protein